MPVTIDQPAPYAPASAILELIGRHRNKGLPPLVDADVLARAGVSDSLIPRTLQALKALDLIEDDGRPSQIFEEIRLAPTAEFESKLAEWLKIAYADALTYVDPATDDEVSIRDAFRKYVPTGQQSRMVSLFVGLFTAAGLIPPKVKSGSGKRSASVAGSLRVSKPQLRKKVERPSSPESATTLVPSGFMGLPPAIAGLLATLPPEGGYWSKERRDGFLATLAAVIDYTFRIGDSPNSEVETATDQ